MKMNKTLQNLSLDIANYIVSDHREEQDYLEHCEENDLKPDDYLNNAELVGAHVFAKAHAFIFHFEIAEQKEAEGDI